MCLSFFVNCSYLRYSYHGLKPTLSIQTGTLLILNLTFYSLKHGFDDHTLPPELRSHTPRLFQKVILTSCYQKNQLIPEEKKTWNSLCKTVRQKDEIKILLDHSDDLDDVSLAFLDIGKHKKG